VNAAISGIYDEAVRAVASEDRDVAAAGKVRFFFFTNSYINNINNIIKY